ncbi:MAG: cadherin-like domain-containing protein [Planctomycetaceae bacterium]|nr:cadherin-like domain-containing protein [Planctomycetaceae bacterium]
MLQKELLRVATLFSRQPHRRPSRGMRGSHVAGALSMEALEPRVLLAGHVLTTTPPTISVQPGGQVQFDVKLDTVPANSLSNGFNFSLHFDSTKLDFVGITNVLSPPTPSSGGQIADNSVAGTDTRIPYTWTTLADVTFTPDLPVTLYTATFTAKAGFAVDTSTKVEFTASTTNVPIDGTGAPFTFAATPLTINAVPVPPAVITTIGDAFSVRVGNSVTGNVLTNDSVTPATALTAALKTDVANGTLALNPDGSFTYTPAAGFVGTDSFVYTVSGGGVSKDETATIMVTDVPDIAGDGNVIVSYSHGNLRVLGDRGNNSIQISGDGTNITVLGLGHTTINGVATPYVLPAASIRNNLLINMRGGNDTVGIKDLNILNNTGVSLGLGNDILEIDHVTGLNDLRVSAGLGNDRVSITNSTFHDNVVVNGSGGNDLLGLKAVEVGHNLIARGAAGSDTVIADNTNVAHNAVVTGGGGSDALGAMASSVGHNLRLTGGGGKDKAQVDESSSVGGRKTVSSVALVSATDSFFEARRHDLFDLLLFS